jgi:lysophospholipase L1-like esterase
VPVRTIAFACRVSVLLLCLPVLACGGRGQDEGSAAATTPVRSSVGSDPQESGQTSTPTPISASAGSIPRAVFLGDSYTVGFGGGLGYVQPAADQLGWMALPSGQSGTGYVAEGIEDWMGPYGERVDEVADARPDVVVVQGSTNDVGRSIEEIRAAAANLYRELGDRLPEADTIVVGPLAAPAVDAAAVRAVRDALREAASTAGVRFVDPIAEGWLEPSAGLYGDGLHPNDAGYGEMADRLAGSVADL